MRRPAVLLATLASLAACGPPEGGPDAGDDDADGGTTDSGLVIQWTTTGIGDEVDGVRVDRLRLNLRDLRVVGDAAGDETYRPAQELELDGGDPKMTRFGDAPPGMYSALEFDIDGGADGERAWDMRGTLSLGELSMDFEIEDDQVLAIDLALPGGLDLAAGETRVITVEIDARAVVDPIDWDDAELEDEHLVIDDDSSQMPGIRARLTAAFSVDTID
jgi:hypothetical protein